MQNQDKIEQLEAEIARLKSDLANLSGACESESEDVTDHIKYIYKYLKMLDDRSVTDLNLVAETMTVLRDAISPMEQEIFPGVAKAREQLAAIRETLRQSEQQKSDKLP